MSYKKGSKRLAAIALSIGLIAPMIAPTLVEAKGKKDTVEVQLLSFNDLHGQYDVDPKYGGGIANLAAHLEKLQAENKNTLTMSAGDAVGGSPAVAALKQDQPTLEMLREMNVDIVTTGNHEYDEGIDELARLVQGGTHESGLEWEGSQDLNWITSNVVAKEDLKFGDKKIKKGDPILKPYTVKSFEGVKVGVIGVVTTDTAKKVIPDGIKDVEFIDEVEAIDKYTKELKKKGVNTIVVLTHVPTKSSGGELIDLPETSDVYDIAQKVNGEVDVIIGADNHQYANSVVKREGKDDIIVTQAYSKGTAIGDIDLTISKETGDVVSYENTVHDVKDGTLPPNATIARMVKQAREDVQHLLDRKIGEASQLISREVVTAGGESELGRMIAQAQLWAVRQKGIDADISMMNAGGVRADLQAGDVTYEDLYTVQPFGNDLTKVNLTGAQLKTFLEDGQRMDRMTQIAGFNYTWHEEVVDGKTVLRIDEIKLENGTPITDDMELTVVMNIYMAQGGDGLSVLGNLDYEVVMGDLEGFELYTKEFSPLKPIDVVEKPNSIKNNK